MGVGAEVSRVIGAADTKAGLLLAAHGVVLASTVSAVRAPGSLPWTAPGIVAVGAALLAVLFLLATLWPRLPGAGSGWFAFTTLRTHSPDDVRGRPALPELADRAWSQAVTLAGIAHHKLRWFRAALLVSAVEFGMFALWVTLSVGVTSTS